MEHEAKYRALQRIKAKHIRQCDFAPYELAPADLHELRDIILDTSSQMLSRQHFSLRIRRDGNTTILTLKKPGVVENAVHVRPEIEAIIDHRSRFDRTQWPADIAQPVAEMIGDAELMPILSVRNRRRVWHVLRDNELVAEIALDRGMIVAHTRTMPFHEVEVELKGSGTADDVHHITTVLTSQLPLVAEPLSKMQRGIQLLNHTEHQEALHAMSEQTPMDSKAVLAEAGRSLAAKHVAKLYAAWSVAYDGDDPEGVHQMRVATRRLRAIFAVLGERVYQQQVVDRLRRGLKVWATDLGKVRDADVFLTELDAFAQTLDPEQRDQLAPLREAVAAEREQARADLLELMDSRKAAKFAYQLDTFVLTAGAGVRSNDDGERLPRVLVRHWLGSIIWQNYEHVRAYEGHFEGAPIEVLHRFRIDVKHLRYVLELFHDALADEVEPLHALLVAAQDHFGALNDADVAITHVNQVLEQHPNNEGLLQYRAHQVAKRTELVADAPKVARTIWDLTFRRRLGALISKV